VTITPGFNAGAAYVFRRHVGGFNHFGPVTKVTASDSSFGFDYFGWAVDISGGTVLVGGPNAGEVPFSGAAYVLPVSKRDPSCRVAAHATNNGVTLDFRVGAALPVDWSVWAWIAGRPSLLWTAPLTIVERPLEFSVPLPGLHSVGISFSSILSTGENGIVCADWANP
jgi:FG-GAP repeat